MRIYWIKDGRQYGPASVPDVQSMLELGELTPDTLGWHTGCEGWHPLRELPALADIMTPSVSEMTIGELSELNSRTDTNLPPLPRTIMLDVTVPSPVVRFLARMVDIALYCTIVLAIMYEFHVPYMHYFHPGALFFWFPMILIEALLLALWGTTPGKRLMGIRLQCIKGRITYASALMRSLLAFIMGTGCLYAFLAPVMLTFSYITVRRRGLAFWDAQTTILPVVIQSSTLIKKLFVCIFLFLSFQLSAIYMTPWVPDIIDQLRETNPETAKVLEELMSQNR